MSRTPRLDDVDYHLPPERIAQRPPDRRTGSRLLCWHADGTLEHRRFEQVVDLLRPGDLLVLNDTRVFPARLLGRKRSGTAAVEMLLVRPREDVGPCTWEAMLRPARRLPPGTSIELDGGLEARVDRRTDDGTSLVELDRPEAVIAHCRRHGHVPLPPYIDRPDDATDRERYQTVFARVDGSVAAPTAGLHFDDGLLERVEAAGVERTQVTLHVGPGTFRPLDEDDVAGETLHTEWCEVGEGAVEALRRTRARGGRVVAVGTTACRSLETLDDVPHPFRGATELFVKPGHRFRWVDVLITNFHLPRSSLLLLVAALAPGRWRKAYEEAVAAGYRFYSYGDANWIERTS